MSGLKGRNRRGRPHKNTTQQAHSQVDQPTVTTTETLDLQEPLTIVWVSKEQQQQQRDNPIHYQQQHNQTNSDNALLFESSDLSSEDDTTIKLQQGVDVSTLPKVQYTSISENTSSDDDDDDIDIEYLKQQKHQEEQLIAQNIGGQIYKKPENHYVHYIEPSDIELYNLVEYDMDEQDKHWLSMYNRERRRQVLDDISPYLFEYIMDKLEKEWFNMIKNAPIPDTKEQEMLPEDSACAVCDDTEVENSNAIVFCDGCNVAVHQDCYGIPYIPEGQWLCRKCMISPEFPVSCIFCPNEGGAFKQTNTNQWGHLLCAIWIPEVGVSNAIYMEPIDTIEHVPKSRWKLTCSLCKKRQGACIQCDYKHCFSAFHVTCAKAAGLCMRTSSQQTEGVILKAYCEKHTPTGYHVHKPVRGVRGRGRGRGRGRVAFTDNKVARAHQLHYSTGVPIVPDRILSKIDNLSCVKFSGARKRQQLVTAVAHYWSLKRESRRGAPLLKRLHLEPWTASAKSSDLVSRKQFITVLRSDLDKVRMLSEQVLKRERQKLERTKKQNAYLQMILFPVEHFIHLLLPRFMEVDRKKYFLNHVTKEQAPDYHKVIKHPMCFSEIQNKLALRQYTSLEQFESDVELIWQNSMQYNASDTSFYKAANKLKMTAQKSLATAKAKLDQLEISEDGTWNETIEPSIFTYDDTIEQQVVDLTEEKVVVETEEEKQLRLEQERIKQQERQRVIQKRVEGRAKARALRQQNKLKGIVQKPQVTKRTLRTRNTKQVIKQEPISFDTNVAELQVSMQHNVVTDFQPQYPSTDQIIPTLEQTRKRQHSISTQDDTDEITVDDAEEQTNEIVIGDVDKQDKGMAVEPPSNVDKQEEGSEMPSTDVSSNVKEDNDKKGQAPVGWVYLDNEEQESVDQPRVYYGSNKARQTRNGIPIPNFQRGEIVWARVDRYPSHPARFLNYSDEEAGPKLTASRRYHGDVLVEFLKVPEMHKYGWVGRRTISGLGDPEVDKKRLSEALQKRPKRNAFISEAKEGYQHAGTLLGIDTEDMLSSVFDSNKLKKSKKRRYNKK